MQLFLQTTYKKERNSSLGATSLYQYGQEHACDVADEFSDGLAISVKGPRASVPSRAKHFPHRS